MPKANNMTLLVQPIIHFGNIAAIATLQKDLPVVSNLDL